MFWHKTNKVERRSFVICNSYSRSKSKLNRFRVFMFYKKPVTSIEQHKMVLEDIESKLKRNGFDKEISGLDSNCKSGIQSFYMPCINREQQDYSFFRKHGLKRIRDIEIFGIDVDLIAVTNLSVLPNDYRQSFAYINIDTSENQQKIDEIIHSIQVMSSGRHKDFFAAAIKLRSLGLALSEIEQACYQMAGNESKMRKKVPGIMRSLRQYNSYEWGGEIING